MIVVITTNKIITKLTLCFYFLWLEALDCDKKPTRKVFMRSQSSGAQGCFIIDSYSTEVFLKSKQSPPTGYYKEGRFKAPLQRLCFSGSGSSLFTAHLTQWTYCNGCITPVPAHSLGRKNKQKTLIWILTKYFVQKDKKSTRTVSKRTEQKRDAVVT